MDVIYWMGRSLIEDDIKTLEPRNTTKPLFGRHVFKLPGPDVFLVEGVFDHFQTPKSYALMGTNLNDLQLDQLKRDGIRRVFLVFDPDANKAMDRTTQKLAKAGITAISCRLPGTLDPGDLGSGIMSPFRMIGNVVGPVFAGFLFDVTGNYRIAFIVFTCLAVMSGISFYFVKGDHI